MNNDIELLQDWLTRHRQTEMNYDCNPTRYECQIFDAIEHIICENAQYSEHNRKLEQALIDIDRELREYKKTLELAIKELDDAKDMLRDAGKNDWAGLLNTSADYFRARAREEMKNE